jgi:predicted ATP-dependent protease
MAAKKIAADDLGLPRFDTPPAAEGKVYPFDFSSHKRAGQALKFGLSLSDPGFNIFVLGENRSGRMTATLGYLTAMAEKRPPAQDWAYLFNFARPHKPKPYAMARGAGRAFRDRLAALVAQFRLQLQKSFEGPEYTEKLQGAGAKLRLAFEQASAELNEQARTQGLRIQQTEQGVGIVAVDAEGNPRPWEGLSADEQHKLTEAAKQIGERMRVIAADARRAEEQAGGVVRDIRKDIAFGVIDAPLAGLEEEYRQHRGLCRWLVQMREDILDNLDQFASAPAEGRDWAGERYAVNLIVDNADTPHMPVVLEPNPSFSRLFGAIEYHSVSGALVTDFRLIRAGALHRANGGILVLRAEAVAREPGVWEALKGALRDGEIRIEEPYRANTPVMVESLVPKPIPLSVKVVLVGAPRWYYAYSSADPTFLDYFRIKADIDPDMDATSENLGVYAQLLREAAASCAHGASLDPQATAYLLGQASRWADARDKLTAKFEMLEDVLVEAGALLPPQAAGAARVIGAEQVRQALAERRRRNARVEDRSQESIKRRTVNIAVTGETVGQVNALTVLDTGDHAFGLPSRVSARVFVGRLGVVNIERMVEMGGPLQQKGVMILEGFLNGRFARKFPLSFSASVTFEQNYGGVEGDSATMAELCALISALADAPLRQDIGITGSMDQLGNAQAIGGAHHKIEGFFRACRERDLTGRQGVIVPQANERNLLLRDDVAEAVRGGKFHVWSVATVDEAVALYTGMKTGEHDARGNYPAGTVYGRVMKRLAEFDRILAKRAAHRG